MLNKILPKIKISIVLKFKQNNIIKNKVIDLIYYLEIFCMVLDKKYMRLVKRFVTISKNVYKFYISIVKKQGQIYKGEHHYLKEYMQDYYMHILDFYLLLIFYLKYKFKEINFVHNLWLIIK
jgi:hypothetical protein